MKSINNVAILVAVVAILIGAPAVAQDQTNQDPTRRDPAAQSSDRERQERAAQDPNRTPASGLDTRTDAPMIRASTLIGHSLVNRNEENVGSVHDIVLDGKTGRVRYVVVTYGGFLGMGNKLFAIPYEALELAVQRTDRTRHQLVLDVTQEQMEGAQGFDADNWPNFHDAQFQSDLMRRYRVDPNRYSDDRGNRR